MYTYKAKLETGDVNADIYDGDSIRLWVDLGFGVGMNIGICRLASLDTPEVRGSERPEGLISRDYVREIMARPENSEFTIISEKDRKGKYGRYIVHIILKDGTNLNEHLIESGYADRAIY